jgi:hypothetical protein
VALAFLEEAKVDRLVIRWDPQEVRPPAQYRNGQALTLPELRMAMQRVLREEMWARFEGEPGTFIHFGYDYYMFLGGSLRLSEVAGAGSGQRLVRRGVGVALASRG